MRYLGGKSGLAKQIVAAITERVGDAPIWEPFCGGASVTVELAKTRASVHASDLHPALIAMYRALLAGWDPPMLVTPDEYQAARVLPDSDPLKAFAGFGCSFGGKWFGGFARGLAHHSVQRDHGAEARRNVLSQVPYLRDVQFDVVDFLAVEPSESGMHIYADPPYAGTTGYGMAFDHALFWKRCQEWTRLGVRVFVSEAAACPVDARVIWSRERRVNVSHQHQRSIVDTLFEVLQPPRSPAALTEQAHRRLSVGTGQEASEVVADEPAE